MTDTKDFQSPSAPASIIPNTNLVNAATETAQKAASFVEEKAFNVQTSSSSSSNNNNNNHHHHQADHEAEDKAGDEQIEEFLRHKYRSYQGTTSRK